jgi:hypothetical protein
MTDDEIKQCGEMDKEGRVFLRRFRYDGWVIMITNLRLGEVARKNPTLEITALLDRMEHLPQLHWDADSMMLRIERLCAEEGMMTAMGLSHDGEREVLNFLRANRRKFIPFTLRTAEKVAEARRDIPEMWQEFSLKQTDN